MAALYTDNYNKQFQSESPNLVSAVDCQASLRAIRDKVITTVDFHNGDIIYVARPLKGWKWGGRSLINHRALGTGITLAVGTGITGAGVAASPELFRGPDDMSGQGKVTGDAYPGIGYEFDGETDVILTIGGADCVVDAYIITEFEFFAVN